jgi:hypothetical protein
MKIFILALNSSQNVDRIPLVILLLFCRIKIFLTDWQVRVIILFFWWGSHKELFPIEWLISIIMIKQHFLSTDIRIYAWHMLHIPLFLMGHLMCRGDTFYMHMKKIDMSLGNSRTFPWNIVMWWRNCNKRHCLLRNTHLICIQIENKFHNI